MLFETPSEEGSVFLSRIDPNESLSSYSRHAFRLDDFDWPSVEHYFQAMKFEDNEYREKIRLASHPKIARRLGRTRWRRIRKDWKNIRKVVMTRAVYIKARTHKDVRDRLLATADKRLVENSQYDYFWGCGRDRRGSNNYGQVLMDVRSKLREESLLTAAD